MAIRRNEDVQPDFQVLFIVVLKEREFYEPPRKQFSFVFLKGSMAVLGVGTQVIFGNPSKRNIYSNNIGSLTMVLRLLEAKIKILREVLIRVALADGILSNEEIEVLMSIDPNLELLHKALVKAYEDRIIDKNESNGITILLNQIEDDAVSVAKFDECITQEDRRLLFVLQKTLIEIQRIVRI